MNSPEKLSILAIGGKSPTGRASELLTDAVDLTGKERGGNVLIIPTARIDLTKHQESVNRATELFSNRLGLPTKTLHGFDMMPDETITDELLEWADLTYISGGDSKRMMDIWKKYGIDSKLRVRAYGGLVLTGISAGAIAPFSWGHSDWEHYHQEDWQFRRVEGLGLINAAITPHNDSFELGKSRQDQFSDMLRTDVGTNVGFGVDNFAGIKISDGKLEVKSATDGAGVTVLDKRQNVMNISRLDTNQPIKLSELDLN
jgi:dipeptidase E